MTQATVTLRITGNSSQANAAINSTSASLGKFKGEADKAGGAAKKAGADVAGSSSGFDRLKGAIVGVGLVLAARQLASVSDAMAGLDARLRITARSTQEYAAANGIVLRIAQETRQSLESTGTLFIRLTTALKDTGASQLEVATLTKTINQAFAVSGASAAEAAAAITQLSQGLAAGALRGDEFNSVAEQAPRIMDALAKSLGVSRGELRKMAEDGKLTADVIRTALGEAAGTIGAEFEQLPVTIGGGLTTVQNAIGSLIGWFDRQTGAGNAIGRFFTEIAGFIEAMPAVAIGVIGQFQIWWENLKALFKAGGIELEKSIMVPLSAIIRGVQLSLLQLAQTAAQLPGGLGDALALNLGKAIGTLNQYVTTSGEYRAELAAVVTARDEAIAGIENLTAAAQEEFRVEQAAIASAKEYASRIRTNNGEKKKGLDLDKDWARAQAELARQQLPVLDALIAETEARRDLRTLLQDMDEFLDDEIALAGLSEEARQLHINAMKAEQFAREVLAKSTEAGNALSEQEIDGIRRSVEARLNLADATAEATEVQARANAELADFAGSYLGQASDAIGEFVAEGLDDFENLWDSFKNIAKRALADLVSTLLRQRIVVPIIAQITGQGGGGGGGVTGAVQQAGSLLGGGGGGGGILGTVGSVAGALGFGGFAAGAGVLGATIGATGSIVGGLAATTQFGLASLAAGNLSVGFGALLGPIGLVVGALAILYTAMQDTTRRITVIGSEVIGTAGFRNLAPDAIRDSALGGFAFASADNVSREERDQLAEAIQGFDAAIAQLLSGDELTRVRAAVSTINTQATEGAISAETFIQRRMEAITSIFDEAVQEFVGAGTDLEAQVQRLGLALGVQRDLAAGIDFLQLEGGLGAVLGLIGDLAGDSEDLAAVYQRVTGATRLLDAAVDLLGAGLNGSREDFVRFADSIAEAAGGLDQAQALWSDFFSSFFSPEELAQVRLADATAASNTALTGIGLGTDTTMAQFRQLFEEALPTLSAEAVVTWLQAGRALAAANAAQASYNETLGQTATETGVVNSTLAGLRWEEYLGGLTASERQIAELTRQFDEFVESARAMGASEAELAEIRAIGITRIQRVIDAEAAAAEAAAAQAAIDAQNYWFQIQQANEQAARDAAAAVRDAFGGLAAYLRGEAFGGTSTLTPQERLSEATGQFQSILQRVGAGDVAAAGEIQPALDRLLQEALAFYGGGDQYRAIREAALAAVTPLAAFGQSGSADAASIPARVRQALALFQSLLGGGVGRIPGVAGAGAANGPSAGALASALPFAGIAANGPLAGASAGLDPSLEAQRETNARLTVVVDRLDQRLQSVEATIRTTGDRQASAIDRLASSGARFG